MAVRDEKVSQLNDVSGMVLWERKVQLMLLTFVAMRSTWRWKLRVNIALQIELFGAKWDPIKADKMFVNFYVFFCYCTEENYDLLLFCKCHKRLWSDDKEWRRKKWFNVTSKSKQSEHEGKKFGFLAQNLCHRFCKVTSKPREENQYSMLDNCRVTIWTETRRRKKQHFGAPDFVEPKIAPREKDERNAFCARRVEWKPFNVKQMNNEAVNSHRAKWFTFAVHLANAINFISMERNHRIIIPHDSRSLAAQSFETIRNEASLIALLSFICLPCSPSRRYRLKEEENE